MPADLTLPGDLPGLLRRGSPVVMLGSPGRGRLGVVGGIDSADLRVTVMFGTVPHVELDCLDMEWLALDLTDPTGCAHAAWWVESRFADPDIDPWQAHCDDLEYAAERPVINRALRGDPLTDDQRRTLRDLCLRLTEVSRG